MKDYIARGEEETKKLAATFVKTLQPGDVIGLIGDLGAGKTTFVRGIVEALGSSVRVKSPTFTVMNEYPIDNHTIKKVLHMDLYRFQNPIELEAIAFDQNEHNDDVIFVEWPDIFDERAFPIRREVYFSVEGPDTRKITF